MKLLEDITHQKINKILPNHLTVFIGLTIINLIMSLWLNNDYTTFHIISGFIIVYILYIIIRVRFSRLEITDRQIVVVKSGLWRRSLKFKKLKISIDYKISRLTSGVLLIILIDDEIEMKYMILDNLYSLIEKNILKSQFRSLAELQSIKIYDDCEYLDRIERTYE